MTQYQTKNFAGFGAGRKIRILKAGPFVLTALIALLMWGYFIQYFLMDTTQMSHANIFNVAMGLVTLGSLTMLSLACALDYTPMDSSRKLFMLLILITTIGVVTDNLGWLQDGRTEARQLYWYMSFASFLVYPVITPVFWFYQNALFLDSGIVTRRSTMLIWVLTVINLCYLMWAGVTGYLFWVDEEGFYHTGPGTAIALLAPFIQMTVCIANNLRHKISLRKRIALLSFCILPCTAAFFQIILADYAIGYVVGAWDLMLIYGVVQMERSIEMARQQQELAEKNRELAEQQMQIMVSQIQPHFMYNALGTISALCTEEPELAQEATDTFADYLRANLNAMGQRQPVSFENELKHVKSYVWIEQLRFQDYLNVVYDIQCKDFLIPALSVQPLVENAIKHGVCKKEEGGTVWISSYETETDYRVVIRDDGVGFDQNQPLDTSRTHVGLQNVRSRLAIMVGGILSIESEPGKGTISTIVIKK